MRPVSSGSCFQYNRPVRKRMKQPPQAVFADMTLPDARVTVPAGSRCIDRVIEMNRHNQGENPLADRLRYRLGSALPSHTPLANRWQLQAKAQLVRFPAQRPNLDQLLKRHAHGSMVARLILNQQPAGAVPSVRDGVQSGNHQSIAFQRIPSLMDAKMNDNTQRAAALGDIQIVEQRQRRPLPHSRVSSCQIAGIRAVSDRLNLMLQAPFLAALGVPAIECFDIKAPRVFGEILKGPQPSCDAISAA